MGKLGEVTSVVGSQERRVCFWMCTRTPKSLGSIFMGQLAPGAASACLDLGQKSHTFTLKPWEQDTFSIETCPALVWAFGEETACPVEIILSAPLYLGWEWRHTGGLPWWKHLCWIFGSKRRSRHHFWSFCPWSVPPATAALFFHVPVQYELPSREN